MAVGITCVCTAIRLRPTAALFISTRAGLFCCRETLRRDAREGSAVELPWFGCGACLAPESVNRGHLTRLPLVR